MNQLTTQELIVVDELSAIYENLAHGAYGLTLLNQLAHAVQSGALARGQGLSAELTVAALLHDIGHMVHELGEHPAAQGIDDCHETVGADWLARYFPAAVVEPVRLHVAAKRYLCAVEASYLGKLSGDSIESLALQGGPMSAAQVAEFEQQPYWRDAVSLRRIDELAKDPHGPAPAFSDFRGEILAVLRATGAKASDRQEHATG